MEIDQSKKEDFTCPICMYILIQPVTMPCRHSLCMPCYKQCVDKTNLTCPLCRMRISSWARKQSRSNGLVDHDKWEAVQRAFPVQVKNRLEDKESSDDEWETLHNFEIQLRKRKEVSTPGAIRKEYEAALEQLHRQQEEEKRKEEAASAALIKALQEEEEEEIADFERQREQNERMGVEAAIQLDQEESVHKEARTASSSTKPSTGSSKKNKRVGKAKAKRSKTSTLKLDTFYEKIRRTSCSAPLISERAPTPGRSSKVSSSGLDLDREMSPYPYICISPRDKHQATPSLSNCSSPLEPHLSEHSYTSASAKHVDLTLDSMLYMSYRRTDVAPLQSEPVIKMEPIDISPQPPEDENPISSAFQPIESFVRTPPRKLPSGQVVQPSLVKAVPRNLSFDDFQTSTSLSNFTNRKMSSPSVKSNKVLDDAIRNQFVERTAQRECSEGDSKFNDNTRIRLTPVHGRKSRMTATATATSSSTTSSSTTTNLDVDFDDNVSNKEGAIIISAENIEDDIITEDTPLVIPLEADLTVCNIENELDPVFLPCNGKEFSEETGKLNDTALNNTCRNRRPSLLQETTGNSKVIANRSDQQHVRLLSSNAPSQPEPTPSNLKYSSKSISCHRSSASSKGRKQNGASLNMSIRQFCVPDSSCDDKASGSRKRKASADSDDLILDESVLDDSLTQEEKDHQMALQLQNLYSKLDKNRIQVDRYKGAKDEYLFRKRKCL